MPAATPRQRRAQRCFEAILRVAAPGLDLTA